MVAHRPLSPSTLARQDAGRDANRQRVRGHIRDHHGIGPDGDVVANPDGTENLRPRADADPVAEDRRTSVPGVPQPHGHAVADHAIVSEDGVAADENASEML